VAIIESEDGDRESGTGRASEGLANVSLAAPNPIVRVAEATRRLVPAIDWVNDIANEINDIVNDVIVPKTGRFDPCFNAAVPANGQFLAIVRDGLANVAVADIITGER
jgi:hypothetical protein